MYNAALWTAHKTVHLQLLWWHY